MRFSFVLPPLERYSPAGGAIATVTRQLAAELQQQGHTVSVLTPDDGADTYPEGDPVRLGYGPARPPSRLRHKLGSAVARQRRWVTHDYGAYVGAVRRELDRLPAEPEVLVVANDPRLAQRLHRRHPRARVVLWLHNLLADSEAPDLAGLPAPVRVVAVSAVVADWTARHHGLARERIVVAHNGVDLGLFGPSPARQPGPGPLRVVCHGRIDPNKGIDLAARAVARLRDERVEITLTVVGSVQTFGWDVDAVREYTRRLDDDLQAASAHRTGRLAAEEVARLLGEHDVACVLPRSDDPFPLAGLEAMASGCAVLATRSGGLPEMLGDAGVLVEKDDLDAVVGVLRSWAGDPAGLELVRTRCRTRAEAFTWSRTCQVLLSVVEQEEHS
jgi:glycosyltransferase involved in cell wall biosynthesis